MKPIRFCALAVATSLLGACAGNSAGNTARDWDTAEVRALSQKGNAFQQALHRDYSALAQWERDQGNWDSVSYYNTNARQSAAGMTVQPTRMDQRVIPAAHVAEMTTARAKLIRLLESGGPAKASDATSRAQTQFDCWMEQQEENHQPPHIALCRDGFMTALNDGSNIVFAAAPPAAPMAQATTSNPTPYDPMSVFVMYFDHNRSDLNAEAKKVAADIVARMQSTNAKTIVFEGYTDRSGTREYNELLAERRATAVAAEVKSYGVQPAIAVSSQSFGEDRPAVQTGDDVKEWQNRRALIRVQ